MKKNKKTLFQFAFWSAICTIVLPILLLALWSISQNWTFPDILPSNFSMRGISEIFGENSEVLSVLLSSVLLAFAVGILSAVIGTMTARAITFYNFAGKHFVEGLILLPIIIPATAFTMGIHIIFIKMGLSDTTAGVIIVHLICAVPYSIKLMTDITSSAGKRLEEQALGLGASPVKAFVFAGFPAILPGFISSVCMGYIVSFSQYFITLIIGGGSVKTFSMIMIPYIQSGDRTISGTYSIIFILSTFIVFAVLERVTNIFTSQRSIGLFG